MLPKRQKLIGLQAKGGKAADDDLPVSDLTLKVGQKIMMMGQPEAHVEAMDKQSEVRQSWETLAALVWPRCRLLMSAVAGESENARLVTASGCDAPSAGGTVTTRSLCAVKPGAGSISADGTAAWLLQCWSLVCPEA